MRRRHVNLEFRGVAIIQDNATNKNGTKKKAGQVAARRRRPDRPFIQHKAITNWVLRVLGAVWIGPSQLRAVWIGAFGPFGPESPPGDDDPTGHSFGLDWSFTAASCLDQPSCLARVESLLRLSSLI